MQRKTLIMTAILCLLGLTRLQDLGAVPAQIIVIRHGEKPQRGTSLNQQGKERSAALTYYFLETPELLVFGPPVAIFASKPGSINSSLREIQTVTPLALAMKISIHSPFTSKQVDELVEMVLNEKRFEGKMVLICWEHSVIPELVQALGVNPRPRRYPQDRFDLTWVITYSDPAHPTLQVLLQKLMFDDGIELFDPFEKPKSASPE